MQDRFFTAMLVGALCVSCSTNDINTSDEQNVNKGVLCTIPSYEDDSDPAQTRSVTYVDVSGIHSRWETGEKIIVYGDGSNLGNFTLQTASQDGKTGSFDGGGFALTANKAYYTFNKSSDSYGDGKHNIPCVDGKYDMFEGSSKNNIKVTYDGQRQEALEETFGDNLATTHLAAYDYMSALATATQENRASFQFKRLGTLLRLVIKGLPVGNTYKKLTMYDATENSFRGKNRTMDITKTSSATYSPYLNELMLTDDDARFEIALGKVVSSEEKGLTVPAGGTLVVYMMIPPVDLTSKTIAFRLTPLNEATDKAYFTTYKGRAFRSGTAVQMTMTAAECAKYNINVKVVQDWAKGNSVAQTRSAGDPGTTVKMEKPKYLYAFFLNGGRLVARAKAVDIPDTDWTDADGIYSYTGKWKNTTNGSDETESTSLTLDSSNGSSPKVYIVASKAAMVFPDVTYGSSTGTEESAILGFTYDYSTQDQMLNLYSTPYCVTYKDFVGALTDDVKDVRLYHVASKVDVNWENTTSTALTGNVSVNSVPTTGLSLFKPTVCGGTGTTNVSTAITPGTAWNGRTTFYLPQPSSATYNMTIGSKTSDITFTPDPVYTSWFRGMVTVKD